MQGKEQTTTKVMTRSKLQQRQLQGASYNKGSGNEQMQNKKKKQETKHNLKNTH
jgi:hypothetical protein